jgi:hypothetical protein
MDGAGTILATGQRNPEPATLARFERDGSTKCSMPFDNKQPIDAAHLPPRC